jgi:mRNA interferase MazF
MKVTFGDILLVNFEPSVGREYKKIRPAIVIQQEDVSEYSTLITVMPMSSQIERRMRHDIFIARDEKNRLTNDSLIKSHYIHTFDPSRVLYFIGRAGSPTVRAVRGYLRRHFGM